MNFEETVNWEQALSPEKRYNKFGEYTINSDLKDFFFPAAVRKIIDVHRTW